MRKLDEKLAALKNTTRFSMLVRERLRFWLRMATRSRALARYRLPRSDVVIHLRHGTVDVLTLDQIFGKGHYDVPRPVHEILRPRSRPLRVIDLGANIGFFGAHVQRMFGDAEITAFEPHPANVDVLRRTVEANGGPPGWRLVAACADVQNRTVPFSIGDEFTTGRIDLQAGERIDVPAVDVFAYLRGVDLLKIDIEGAEWSLLSDPRFAQQDARVVALEYHAFRAPGPDPHADAVALLTRAGYETLDAPLEAEEGHGMLWAWRRQSPQGQAESAE